MNSINEKSDNTLEEKIKIEEIKSTSEIIKKKLYDELTKINNELFCCQDDDKEILNIKRNDLISQIDEIDLQTNIRIKNISREIPHVKEKNNEHKENDARKVIDNGIKSNEINEKIKKSDIINDEVQKDKKITSKNSAINKVCNCKLNEYENSNSRKTKALNSEDKNINITSTDEPKTITVYKNDIWRKLVFYINIFSKKIKNVIKKNKKSVKEHKHKEKEKISKEFNTTNKTKEDKFIIEIAEPETRARIRETAEKIKKQKSYINQARKIEDDCYNINKVNIKKSDQNTTKVPKKITVIKRKKIKGNSQKFNFKEKNNYEK